MMFSGRQLPCGHVFHVSCLYLWVEQNTTCPICRLSFEDLTFISNIHTTSSFSSNDHSIITTNSSNRVLDEPETCSNVQIGDNECGEIEFLENNERGFVKCMEDDCSNDPNNLSLNRLDYLNQTESCFLAMDRLLDFNDQLILNNEDLRTASEHLASANFWKVLESELVGIWVFGV